MSDDLEGITTQVLGAFRKFTNAEAAWSDEATILSAPISGLCLDSLDKLEAIMQLEDAFNISFDEIDIENCATMSDLAGLIDRTIRRSEKVQGAEL